MTYLLNAAYLLALFLLSPWLLYKSLTTGKYRRGLWSKFTGRVVLPPRRSRRIWFHGVSVGEIHLLQTLVSRFRQRHPDCECILSTTTDTGFEEARKRFLDLPIIYWPLDFTWSVRRALRAVQPNLVVLAEGELWPNFLMTARSEGVPIAVVNGRMSPRSAARYHRLRPLARRLLRCLNLIAVQTEAYAAHYRNLSADPDQVQVTGSVKFDGVNGDRGNPRTESLRQLFGVTSADLVWIAGSTQAPEEEIVLNIFRRLQPTHPNLRLFLVPRQKDRFDEVAHLLHKHGMPFVRRSTVTTHNSSLTPHHSPLTLIDTIGELGALWGLADVAYVGGSLDGRRGGQNMIEPAAYGAAVLFGPHVWNFRDTADRLAQAGAAIQVNDATELETVVQRLLGDALERLRLGTAAKEFVFSQQGATERTIDLLDQLLEDEQEAKQAA